MLPNNSFCPLTPKAPCALIGCCSYRRCTLCEYTYTILPDRRECTTHRIQTENNECVTRTNIYITEQKNEQKKSEKNEKQNRSKNAGWQQKREGKKNRRESTGIHIKEALHRCEKPKHGSSRQSPNRETLTIIFHRNCHDFQPTIESIRCMLPRKHGHIKTTPLLWPYLRRMLR